MKKVIFFIVIIIVAISIVLIVNHYENKRIEKKYESTEEENLETEESYDSNLSEFNSPEKKAKRIITYVQAMRKLGKSWEEIENDFPYSTDDALEIISLIRSHKLQGWSWEAIEIYLANTEYCK